MRPARIFFLFNCQTPELHPQLAADKSLIEICLQMFVMVYHMKLRMSLFPFFAEENLH